MTEPAAVPAQRDASAGALLRAARERQGLHIAALAAAIKVPPRKLEALENDRYDELPDATFTRALAQTVCRTLKIDAAPVLAPAAAAPRPWRWSTVDGGLNAPFRERPGRAEPGLAGTAIRPAGAGPRLVLLVAALVVYFLPPGWLVAGRAGAPAPASAADAGACGRGGRAAGGVGRRRRVRPRDSWPALAAVGAAAPPAVEIVHSAPPPTAAASAPAAAGRRAGAAARQRAVLGRGASTPAARCCCRAPCSRAKAWAWTARCRSA